MMEGDKKIPDVSKPEFIHVPSPDIHNNLEKENNLLKGVFSKFEYPKYDDVEIKDDFAWGSVGKDESKPISRIWGAIGALIMFSLAGLLFWLLLHGLMNGEILTYSKVNRYYVTRDHDPILFRLHVIFYGSVVMATAYSSFSLLRSLRKKKEKHDI